MNYREEMKTLSRLPEKWHFVHCICADFGENPHAADLLEQHFGTISALRSAFPEYSRQWRAQRLTSDCLASDRTFSLVISGSSRAIPAFAAVRSAFAKLRGICLEQGITHLAMPRFGNGLDLLPWEKVSSVIRRTFEGTDISFLVCFTDAEHYPADAAEPGFALNPMVQEPHGHRFHPEWFHALERRSYTARRRELALLTRNAADVRGITIGTAVAHRCFGDGTVEGFEQEGALILVRFGSEVKKFPFPAAFNDAGFP